MATKNKYTDIDLSKYSQGYKASSDVKTAEAQKKAAEQAVAGYGKFQYSNDDAYKKGAGGYDPFRCYACKIEQILPCCTGDTP